MRVTDWVPLLGGVAGLVGAIGAIVAMLLTRRSDKETNEAADELNEFTILQGVVATLSAEVDRLKANVVAANEEAEKNLLFAQRLHRELEAAQENVRILSAHIRQHLPDVPFPKLRLMNDVG